MQKIENEMSDGSTLENICAYVLSVILVGAEMALFAMAAIG